MSLPLASILSVPEQTAEVAHVAFPKGNRYLQMRDTLGAVYTHSDFADLYPPVRQPAEAPWRLASVTIMQLAENLTDRQAADAVRGRIDWQLTETCDDDAPSLMTHVETTLATDQDVTVVETMHHKLAAQALLPKVQ